MVLIKSLFLFGLCVTLVTSNDGVQSVKQTLKVENEDHTHASGKLPPVQVVAVKEESQKDKLSNISSNALKSEPLPLPYTNGKEYSEKVVSLISEPKNNEKGQSDLLNENTNVVAHKVSPEGSGPIKKSKDVVSKIENKPVPNADSELKIPVPVIYNQLPEYIQNQKNIETPKKEKNESKTNTNVSHEKSVTSNDKKKKPQDLEEKSNSIDKQINTDVKNEETVKKSINKEPEKIVDKTETLKVEHEDKTHASEKLPTVPVVSVNKEGNQSNKLTNVTSNALKSESNLLVELLPKPQTNDKASIKIETLTSEPKNKEQIKSELSNGNKNIDGNKGSHEESGVTKKVSDLVSKIESKPIPSADIELKIPVPVIYDKLPEYILNQKNIETPKKQKNEDKINSNVNNEKSFTNNNDKKKPQDLQEKPKGIDEKLNNDLKNEETVKKPIDIEPKKVVNKTESQQNTKTVEVHPEMKVLNETKTNVPKDDTTKKSTSKENAINEPKSPSIPPLTKPEINQGSEAERIKPNRQERKKVTPDAKESSLNNKDNLKGKLESTAQKNTTKTETVQKPKFMKRTGPRDPVIPIVTSENFVYSAQGQFHYSYESGDGTKAFEKGQLRDVDDSAGEAVVGGFSYIGKDGNDYSLTYTADENGYRPVGAHLPTPPPIPPAIARALKYLATKTTPEPITEPTTKKKA